jgi:acyl carrier protein
MTKAELLAVVRDELERIAPDVAFASVDPEAPIQQEFDIDSMDFLNFITALHERTGINVPETDYPRVRTIAGALRYLEEMSAQQPP